MSFTTDSIPRAAFPLALGYRRLSDGLARLTRHRQGAHAGGAPQPTPAAPRERAGNAQPALSGGPRPPESGAERTVRFRSHPDLEVAFDADSGLLWQWLRPRHRPSFSMELLDAMRATYTQIDHRLQEEPGAISYVVTGSRVPGIFNLGGDLPHFAELIRRGDKDTLRAYAHACIDVQYARATNVGRSYVSISLVQGDALGGGFECALADDVIIAERGAKFGLPEVLFGLFPGMGAYSFLTRKLGDAMAERMLLSGRIYSAEELHDLGLVAMVAEPGAGPQAVADFVKREQRTFRARTALSKIRQRVEPVTRAELIDITDTWVDTAMTLGPAELRKMARLATAQDRRWQQILAAEEPAGAGNGAAAVGA